jgi:hypothetical protein
MQTHRYGLAVSRGDIALALHEWHAALAAADASVEADLYECAGNLVMEYLERHTTFHDLLDAFVYPEIALMRLVTELCTEGAFRLQPRLLMGASCALRLRHLVGEAAAR